MLLRFWKIPFCFGSAHFLTTALKVSKMIFLFFKGVLFRLSCFNNESETSLLRTHTGAFPRLSLTTRLNFVFTLGVTQSLVFGKFRNYHILSFRIHNTKCPEFVNLHAVGRLYKVVHYGMLHNHDMLLLNPQLASGWTRIASVRINMGV